VNYRHAFHAGNFGDVAKHAALCLILDHLRLKDKPFVVLDSHAGIGVYDLAADEPNRTGEYRAGVARLFGETAPAPSLLPYLGVVRAFNPDGALRRYPGSPAIVRHMLREGDHLMACELHPVDHATLAAAMQGDARVRVYALDGYLALKAFLPPKPRRGLVLIDPPFEATDEFSRLIEAVRGAHRRWASGIYLIWLPIKDRRAVATFYGELAMTGIPRILRAELMVRASGDAEGFDGCALVIINPPWTLTGSLNRLLPVLAQRLAVDDGAGFAMDWLSPETAPAMDARAEPA
jgi:23S rRNA (adenine2030-N6)-methyltransferase